MSISPLLNMIILYLCIIIWYGIGSSCQHYMNLAVQCISLSFTAYIKHPACSLSGSHFQPGSNGYVIN